MDHAIADLKSRMNASIQLYNGLLPKEDIKPEVVAYVKAINELEKYYYGEAKTKLENVIY